MAAEKVSRHGKADSPSPSREIGNPEKEYEQALQHIRFFLDYRTKIFGFCVTINGAALTLAPHQEESGEIWLWGFALAVTIACLLAEWRSMNLIDQYRAAARRIEAVLGFRLLTDSYEYARAHGVSLRVAFRLLYVLFILICIGRMAVAVVGMLALRL